MAVPTNVQSFQFVTRGGSTLEMHGELVAWQDQLKNRLAGHEYVMRDGAEQQPLGVSAGRFTFRCVLIGEQVAQRYREIRSTVVREPRGTLTHPRLGSLKVAWESIDASEDAAQAVDTIEYTIAFVEDALDTAVVAESRATPQERAGAVTNASTTLNISVAARYAGSFDTRMLSIPTLSTALTTAASTFATAALVASQSVLPDPALLTLLGAVATKRDALLTALLDTLDYTLESDVSLATVRQQARLVYAHCLEMYNAVIALKPPTTYYTVPTLMSLDTVLTTLYGRDAAAKRGEVLLLNRIPTPHLIPPGFRLLVSVPQVRA